MGKEIVNAESNIGKKKRNTTSGFERILKSCLSLSLKDRVDLKNGLASSIEKELEELENRLKDSRNIANGVK